MKNLSINLLGIFCFYWITSSISQACLSPDGRFPPTPSDVTKRELPPGGGQTGEIVKEPVLFILVEFSDVKHKTEPEDWYCHGFSQAQSLQDYYQEVSYGGFALYPAEKSGIRGVAGWYQITWGSAETRHPTNSKGTDWYTDSQTLMEIARASVQAASADVDFGTFDSNIDGRISSSELHVVLVIAGFSGYGGVHPHVWPRFSCFWSEVIADNKMLFECPGAGVAFIGELDSSSTEENTRLSQLGISCHEMGHDLGLPDLYDRDKESENSAGIGNWGLMGSGDHLGLPGGTSPAHLCAWSKAQLNFLSPQLVTQSLYEKHIPPVEEQPIVYRLNTPHENEYFLVENRQKMGYDEYLCGSGLLIWHIDEWVGSRYSKNEDEAHKGIDLECPDQNGDDHVIDADGLDRESNCGTCSWPKLGKFTFSPISIPSTLTYVGEPAKIAVRWIQEKLNGFMQADLIVGDEALLEETWRWTFELKKSSETEYRVLINGEPGTGLNITSWRFTLCFSESLQFQEIRLGSDAAALSGIEYSWLHGSQLLHEYIADGDLSSVSFKDYEALLVVLEEGSKFLGTSLRICEEPPEPAFHPVINTPSGEFVPLIKNPYDYYYPLIDSTLEIAFSGPGKNPYSLDATCMEGEKGITATIFIDVDEKDDKIQGWSYGVRHDPNFLELKSVTTVGTDLEKYLDMTGFDSTQVTEGGFVSSIILSFMNPVYPPPGRHSVAIAEYKLVTDPGCKGTYLEFTEELRSGPTSPPMDILFSLGSTAKMPILIQGIIRIPKFLRGDSNGDGEIDLSDPIGTIFFAFMDFQNLPCLDAADADNSGEIDLADVILTVNYLFLSGNPPSVPFSDCGCDPSSDPEDSLGCSKCPENC